MPADRTGILIIRAWIEHGSVAPLRAHIRRTIDIAAGLQGGTTVTDEDAVAAVVRAWLQEIRVEGPTSADIEPVS